MLAVHQMRRAPDLHSQRRGSPTPAPSRRCNYLVIRHLNQIASHFTRPLTHQPTNRRPAGESYYPPQAGAAHWNSLTFTNRT